MSPSELLAKKLKLWFVANEPRPSPVPDVRTDATLPRDPPDGIGYDRDIANQLAGLRVFDDKAWDGLCRDLSGMLSRLSEQSRQRLLESLSLISSPPPIDPILARRWMWAVSSLLPSSYPTGIMEFFQLAWIWDQIKAVAGIGIDSLLGLFYRALRAVGEGPRSAAMIHFLVQLAGRWPERFCYWLDRTSEVGSDVIQALKRAEPLLAQAAPHARESLLDFSAEMGWRFLGDEHLPLWRAVGRLGEVMFRRLRGMAMPPNTLDLLAGVLGELERAGDITELLGDVKIRVVSGMFGEQDRTVIEEALRAVPEVHRALEAVGEMELIAEVAALRSNLSQPLAAGSALVRLATGMGGGRLDLTALLGLLSRYEGQLPEAQILEAAALVSEIRGQVPRHTPEEWFRMIRLLGLSGVDGDPARASRNPAAKTFESIVMTSDASAALSAVELAFTIPGLELADVLQAASFILRSADPDQVPALLGRTGEIATMLSLLAAEDRERLLASLPPQWLVSLALEQNSALSIVDSALERIRTRTLRLRFLEKVVSPVLEELADRSDVFDEYMTASVAEYNKTPSQENALRDAEHDLMKRLFSTGDRARVIEETIAGLMHMPGMEGERAEALLDAVRAVCTAFGRQAVWQESTDSTLPGFLQRGLPRLVRIFFDYPEALDVMGLETLQEYIAKLMPSSEGGEADPQVARWQTRTGVVFFGQVIPSLIELFPGDPARMAALVREIADQAVRTVQGVVAGAAYLSDIAMRIEQQLVDNYTTRFQAEQAGRQAREFDLPGGWVSETFENWNLNRAPEAALSRDAVQIARAVTSDRRLQRLFAHEARKLWEGMSRAGLLQRPTLVRSTGMQAIQQIGDIGGGDLLDIVRLLERGEGMVPPAVAEKAERFFSRRSGEHPGENACRAWRLETFTPLGSVLIDLLMIEGSRPSQIDVLTESFLEVAEFLGTETGGDELLLAFERCLSIGEGNRPAQGVREALKIVEKQLFRPLWRRRAMSRIELLVTGMGSREKLVDRLLDRLAREPSIVAQVRFLRRFGRLFLAVEESTLHIEDRRQALFARDSLAETWLFTASGQHPDSAAETAREAFETALEVFRTLRRREGAVTAVEAEQISVEMRRKHRDNAEVVTILLRWTLEPSREDLLDILESNPALLEAAGRDTELIHLLDTVVHDNSHIETVRSLAADPSALKQKLKELS